MRKHVISRLNASLIEKWEFLEDILLRFTCDHSGKVALAKIMDEHKKFLADRLLSEEQPVCLGHSVSND